MSDISKSDQMDSQDGYQTTYTYAPNQGLGLMSLNPNDGMVRSYDDSKAPLRDQDRFLPIANVSKIMRKAIKSSSGKIAKETKERVQECLSEFVSFITSEAADKCHQEKRKTINGDDLIHALRALGFDNYVDPLTQFLTKYRESNKLDMALVSSDTDYTQNMYQGDVGDPSTHYITVDNGFDEVGAELTVEDSSDVRHDCV